MSSALLGPPPASPLRRGRVTPPWPTSAPSPAPRRRLPRHERYLRIGCSFVAAVSAVLVCGAVVSLGLPLMA
jgi:hypothetical protein